MDTPQKILSDRYIDMGRDESLALTLNLKQYRDVTDLDKTKHLNSGLQRVISTIQIELPQPALPTNVRKSLKDTVDASGF